jgi:hypothetical protein
VNGFEQNLLFGVTVVILAGTLIVFVVQYLRRRHDDDRDE